MAGIRRTIRLTVIKASKLPQSYHVKAPNCYAEISADGEPVNQTECKTGINPQWNDSPFDLEVREPSIIKVAIFRRSKPPFSKPQVIPMGEVLLPAGDILIGNCDAIENTYELQKHGSSKSGKYGSLIVRLQLIEPQSGFTEANQEPGQSGDDSKHKESSKDQPAAGASDDAKLPLEDQIGDLLDEADRSAAKLSNVKGMSVVENTTDTIDVGATIGDSSGFAFVCGYVEELMKIGDTVSKIHPWASLAWSILSVIPKTLIAQVHRDQKVQCLWETAADMLAFLKDAKPMLDDILASIVSDMMKQIYHCAIFVREYGGGGFFERTAQEMFKSRDNIISQYTSAFQQLKERFEARSRLATLKVLRDVSQGVVQLSNILDDLRDMEQIKSLESLRGPELEGVRCDKYAVCLPATRKTLLSEIMHWVTEPDGKRTLWLHGVAGSGKSAVANTIASLFMEMGLLGASFRFNQHIQPKYLFRNIAYQLALFDGRFREGLLQALKTHGAMNSYSLREQLERFIVQPFNAVLFVGPVIIVIDALDECGVESERREVLDAIAKELPNLPCFVKVILTSRYERDIRAILAAASLPKSIHETEGITDDILTYIDRRMHDVVCLHPTLETHWPGPNDKKSLCSRADGLFIWVTVASEYIKTSLDPDRALDDVLRGQGTNAQRKPEAPLDVLYLGILQRTPALLDSIEVTKYVVGSILVAKTPLTQTGLDSLLGLGKNVVQTLQDRSQIQLTSSVSLIYALGSILRVNGEGVIQVLHASVIDFFTDPNRCTDERFFIDRSKYNRELAIRCFKTMDGLKRDICAVNDPTRFNSEIPDLEERLNKYLPEHLRYACCFWHPHLEDVKDEDCDTYDLAKGFFYTHLLHWIEVKSLLRDVNGVFLALNYMKLWFQRHPNCEADVSRLVNDSLRMLQRFHEPIQLSAAHVYVSAIPLTPSSSILFKAYAPKLTNIPKLISGDAPAATWTDIRRQSSSPLVVSFSPNGSWFVCINDNNQLEIWDVVGCYPIRAPLTGHGSRLLYISFSHDGTKFCSLDAAGRVLIWDAATYEAIGVPIQLPYSEASIGFWAGRVIACDFRGRVTLWEVETGALVLDFTIGILFYSLDLQGAYLIMQTEEEEASNITITSAMSGEDVTHKYAHGEVIKGARLSPDSDRVACLYQPDNHIKILDVHSGTVIGDVDVDSYNGKVLMEFSSNGKRLIIVKGKSISIYNVDIDAAKLVHGPFEREYTVNGAVLSFEENRLLVWGLSTFEVLDMPSGNVVATGGRGRILLSPRGHISPNGSHVIFIISGDISVFEVASLSANHNDNLLVSVTPSPTGRQILFTLSDRTLRLMVDISSACPVILDGAKSPAAFSPEGSAIVSAYIDHTLQLWDAKEARMIGKPLRGHQKAITAIAFSPTGSWLISAHEDNTIRIRSAASGGGELLQLKAYTTHIWSISMSSDESRIMCSIGNGFIQTLNAKTGLTIGLQFRPELGWAEFMPGGNEIIWVSADGQSCCAEIHTGRITQHSMLLPTQKIIEAVFCPKKTHLITISRSYIIDFSDITTSSGPSSGAASHIVRSLTFSYDGRWMISVTKESSPSHRICRWDSQSGQLVWETWNPDYSNITPSVAISHSGNLVVIWGSEVCLVRDASLGTIISLWKTKSPAQRVTFSADEKQIICLLERSRTSEKWDIESGTILESSQGTADTAALDYASMQEEIRTSAVSPDGTRLAAAHIRWTLTLHNIADGTDKVILELLDSHINLPKFSANGSEFTSVVKDTVIYVWDTLTGNLLGESLKHVAAIESLAFSPDGTRTISICINMQERSAQMWHVTEGSVTTFDQYGDVTQAAFFPDGARLITMSKNGTIIWDISSGTPSILASTLSAPLVDIETNVAISPDGTRLLSCSFLWDIVHRRLLRSFYARAAKFSPDSTRVAYTTRVAYSSDPYGFHLSEQIHILDATTGATLYQSNPFDSGWFSFSFDSTRLLHASSDGIARILDLRCLPTSVDVEILSCVYPQDCMMTQRHEGGGWYHGVNGARLMWLPRDMLPTWLAIGRPPLESSRLFIGDSAILNMDDYLEMPVVDVAWRKGGIRYMPFASQTSALVRESGSTNAVFSDFAG